MNRPAHLKASRVGHLARGIVFVLAVVLAIPLHSSSRPAKRPNFVIFLVDMLRPDHLGVYGYAKNTSPNLDRLAERGIVFDNARSAAPWTFPSTVSLLTGLFPSEHGATHMVVDDATQEVSSPADPEVWLPRKFRERGYATAAFHTHQYLRRDVSNIYKAFEEYYYPPGEFVERKKFTRGSAPWTKYMYLDTLYPACERWLEKNYKRNFLLYIHVIDVHGPYQTARFLSEDREEVQKGLSDGSIQLQRMDGVDMFAPTDRKDPFKSYLYDAQIHYVDGYLQKLVDKLEELGISEDTYVIVTADHGEEFGEHDDYWGHGKFVYDSQVRVPLVLLSHRRTREAPRRISSLVNTVGLLPTLADLAGIKLEANLRRRSFSRLLRSAKRPRDWRYLSISETSRQHGYDAIMIDDQLKLITDRTRGTRELFDLAADPGETKPLDPGSMTPTVQDELAHLTSLRRSFIGLGKTREQEDRELSQERIDALKALGYLQ